MKNILITGSTGFIGRNVNNYLKNKNYNIFKPNRLELNLFDQNEVFKYLKDYNINIVLHFANPYYKNENGKFDEILLEQSLRMFNSFYVNSSMVEKVIYSGSGAEFDKSRDIINVSENDFLKNIPLDSYGFSKMIMNQFALSSNNIYNFRIFGCFGPTDAPNKFITHCIRSIILNKPITVRKDCKFDYIYVEDYAKYIEWGLEHDLKFHDYNVASGTSYYLTEIASFVKNIMNSDLPIVVLSDDLNKDYTSDSSRIQIESGMLPEFSLVNGIRKQVEWEIENFNINTVFDGE